MAIKHFTTKAPGDKLYAIADWNASHTGTDGYDAHLANKNNPHTVTSAQVGAVDLVSNQSVGGVKTLTSIPILPVTSPTNDNHAVRKKYVDDVAVGITWKKPVLDMDLSEPPAEPDIGDRYRVNPPGAGAWLGYNNHLMEWGGEVWASDGAPVSGWAVFSTDDSKGWVYDGTSWVQFTGGLAYEAGDGLELIGTTFGVDLKENDGLAIKDTELGVDYDNSSIGIVSDKLAVKSLGITNAMLAGSIDDIKLNTITTADKVDWAAVNKTGSELNDIDDVNAPAPSNSQLLSWDEGTGRWVPKTIDAESAIEFVIDGGGAVITTGEKGDLEIPFNCTIQSATLLADEKGDIKVDIWVNSYGNYPPTNGDTITNGNEPELVSDDKYQDTTLTDWTTTLTKGQAMRFNVDSCDTIKRCTVSLKVNKT